MVHRQLAFSFSAEHYGAAEETDLASAELFEAQHARQFPFALLVVERWHFMRVSENIFRVTGRSSIFPYTSSGDAC
jgi:hypothetical protein